MKFIGIGGSSRSGKTTLAHRIQEFATAQNLTVECIHQDDLLLPDEQLPRIKGRLDWEKPETIDSQKQNDVIEDAFTRNDIIVIEGIFMHPAFRPQLDKFIYLKLDRSEFLNRRKNETRWGEEEDWYIEYVWDEHQNFYETSIKAHLDKTIKIEILNAENISDAFIEKLIIGEKLNWK